MWLALAKPKLTPNFQKWDFGIYQENLQCFQKCLFFLQQKSQIGLFSWLFMDGNLWNAEKLLRFTRVGPIFIALLTAKFYAYDHHFLLEGQVPNFCASCVSLECLDTWSSHAHKPKFPVNLWNTLDISAEFPASTSADSLLTARRAMNLGTGLLWGLKNRREIWTNKTASDSARK